MTTLSTKKAERVARLIPNGIPKYIRCFDNGGESFDRYTVTFSGTYKSRYRGVTEYIGMSENPFDAQGFGQHGEMPNTTSYKHLGKRIKFTDLPEDCKIAVLRDYKLNWDLSDSDVDINK